MQLSSIAPHSTLEDRAQRLFNTKGVAIQQLDPSLFTKSKNSRGKDPEKQRETALIEAQVYRFAELLGVSVCMCVRHVCVSVCVCPSSRCQSVCMSVSLSVCVCVPLPDVSLFVCSHQDLIHPSSPCVSVTCVVS